MGENKVTTWEDILGNAVGLADKFFCATCLNRIFRGSTGHWGQRIVLNKVPVPGNLIDEDTGKPLTFQCPDCTGREPIVLPQVHPNGELVNHINISELNDAGEGEHKASFGDYDNREQHAAISKQDQEAEKLALEQKQYLPDDVAQRIANEIDEEQAEEVVHEYEESQNKDNDTSQHDRQKTHTQSKEQPE